MGIAIVETAEYTAEVPSVADGDPASGAIFTAPSRALANRAAYFKQQIDGTGVKRLRIIASAASLRTLGSQVAGDFVTVSGLGLYQYFETYIIPPDNGVTVIVPSSGQPGYWSLVGAGKNAIGAASGVAPLNSSGKVPAANLPNSLVSASSWTGADTQGGTTPWFFENTLSLTCAAGDVLVINGNVRIQADSALFSFVLTWSQGGSGFANVPGALISHNSLTNEYRQIGGVLNVPGSGAVTLKIKAFGSGTHTLTTDADLNVLRYAA